MAVALMYNHFAITVTTARNSGMIGFGLVIPELLLIGRTIYQTRPKMTLAATAAQLLRM